MFLNGYTFIVSFGHQFLCNLTNIILNVNNCAGYEDLCLNIFFILFPLQQEILLLQLVLMVQIRICIVKHTQINGQKIVLNKPHAYILYTVGLIYVFLDPINNSSTNHIQRSTRHPVLKTLYLNHYCDEFRKGGTERGISTSPPKLIADNERRLYLR